MYSYSEYLQTIDASGEIIRGLVETAKITQPTRMLCSMAYASFSGCKMLHEYLFNAIPRWESVRKDWLVGLDNGITEPKSLEYLANLKNSTVHLYDADYLLDNNLHARQKFHTKIYFFESDKNGSIGMFSGSANLTLSGLFLNTEQAVSSILTNPTTDDEKLISTRIHIQSQNFKHLFDKHPIFSVEIYKRYKELSKQKQELVKNEDERRAPKSISADNPEFNLNKATTIANANNYWVEVKYVVANLGTGRSGNQIDLQRGSRVFFGFNVGKVPKNTVFGKITINYKNKDNDCNMRFGNNQMDKLNLPAPSDLGLDTYENKILLFTRISDESFTLQVLPLSNIRKFIKLSVEQNSSYKMKSGRKYGVFT